MRDAALQTLQRPPNLLRLAALIGFAMLAGLALVVALTTGHYAAAGFQQHIGAGWADLRASVPYQAAVQRLQQPGERLVLAPLYGVSVEATAGAGSLRRNAPQSTGDRISLLVAFEPQQVRALPQLLVGPRMARRPLRPGEVWVTSAWARRYGVQLGDELALQVQLPRPGRSVTLVVAGIGDPLAHLFVQEELFAYPLPASLPFPEPHDPALLLAALGEQRLSQLAAQISPAGLLPAWIRGPTHNFLLRPAAEPDADRVVGPYQLVALIGQATSAFMALLACFAVACALWLAASLYLQAAPHASLQGRRLLLGLQAGLLYQAALVPGVFLGGYGPNMVRWGALGLSSPSITDISLMRQALLLLLLLVPPALPALIWLRQQARVEELRRSRLGHQLRAGLVGSVVLVTALGLAVYAAGWWQHQSLLFYNILAAALTGVLGGVGPLAVMASGDQSYRSAARSAGTALFICLLLAFSFCMLGALLLFWSLRPVRDLTVFTALGATLAGVVLGYLGAIVLSMLLALSLGAASGVLVVAFGRRVSAGDRESMAENAQRIEGLLLLSRLVLPVLLGVFMISSTSAPLLLTALRLYLAAVGVLILLLRFYPERLMFWTSAGLLVDAAAISTLVAVDGGLQSPFFMLYFLALLSVAMRFGSFTSLAASAYYSLLYLVALVSAEGWLVLSGDQATQVTLANRLLLLLFAGLLASLLAGERQRALLRLDAANRQLLAGEVLRRELEIARQIQQNLFPQVLPRLAGLELAARCLPARETGGDFFDLLVMGQQRLALVVGDVSGKSVPAAMVMAMARSAFRAEILDGYGPARALTKANLTLQGAGRGIFIAAQYGLLDPACMTLTLANAGQLAPLLCRAGQTSLLQPPSAGLPLGIVPEGRYHEQTYQLKQGDLLLFYTDGVVEAMNGQRELYGFERLEHAVQRGAALEPAVLIEQIVAEIASFVGPREQHDDMTLLALRLEPAGSPMARPDPTAPAAGGA